MNIDVTTKTIGELALEMPGAIAVLEKRQIDYCCRGHRSIEDACRAAGVPLDELMAEIGEKRSIDQSVQQKSLTELQHYIVDTHHNFTRQAMETIRLLADKVAHRHGPNHPEVIELQALTVKMYDDLIPHMLKEEQILFPYIQALETAAMTGGAAPVPFFGTVKNPIRMMLAEHETVGELLVEARTVTKNYQLPQDACLSFRALYERLTEIEEDLHRHIHLENNLLFPRAAELEESRGSKTSFGASGEHNCACSH